MKILAILLCVLLQFASTTCARAQQPVEDVSLIALIANPTDYDGKRVRVHGFLNLEFEGNALYVNEEAFDAAIHDAIWIVRPRSLTQAQAKALSRQYAIVEGTFSATEQGHLGAFRGALLNVSRLERWPSRNEFITMIHEPGPGPWPLFVIVIGAVALVGWVTYRIALRVQRSA